MNSYYEKFRNAHDAALAGLEVTNLEGEQIDPEVGFDMLCDFSVRIRDSGKEKYLVGNGASAAFANHMALDWTKNGGVPAHAFANSALLTAMGNDLGYEEAFAAPLSWYGKDGDLLITISSSGNSSNILKTIDMARKKEITVVTLSGLKPDNKSRKMGDLNLYIPAKTYGIVECAHQVLLHVWLDKFMGICEWGRNSYQNMNHDAFQI